MVLSCKDFIKRSHFRSYSEFYLACCIAAACKNRGYSLDMSMMDIDRDVLPDKEVEYFKYLVSTGAILLSGSVDGSTPAELPALYLDMSKFDKIGTSLVENRDSEYFWSFEWAFEKYRNIEPDLLVISKMGNVIIHIVASLLVDIALEMIPKKRIVVFISEFKVMSTYFYVNLLSCSKTLDWFSDSITLDIDFSELKTDINYSIFCNNSIAAKHNKLWSAHEKKAFMEKEGLVEGAIAVLWRRKGMCVSNPAGRLLGSSIIRIDEILPNQLAVTTIAINKTKEELEDDYYSIPEDKRYLFGDILYSKPNMSSTMLSLYNTGIQDYFLTESEFIARLDEFESVTKKITVDGVTKEVEMSEIDAIYWLLCQYEIDFDSTLYKRMYNEGKDLLWDMYGEG